jgi:hypothetical protein
LVCGWREDGERGNADEGRIVRAERVIQQHGTIIGMRNDPLRPASGEISSQAEGMKIVKAGG